MEHHHRELARGQYAHGHRAGDLPSARERLFGGDEHAGGVDAMTRNTQSNPRAFTLIEVMIAMAVFAIVLAAINGIFWGALRLRNKTVESIDAALPKERALAIIRSDLANIVPPGGKFLT